MQDINNLCMHCMKDKGANAICPHCHRGVEEEQGAPYLPVRTRLAERYIVGDIISKNGVMLLNILQRPDGTIDEDADYILEKIGEWFDINSEAVYGTRPWRVFGEGDTFVKIEGFKEEKTNWNRNDFRFVQKDGAVYAFMMGAAAGDTVVLRSFAQDDVKSVELLGYGPVAFKKEYGVLVVQLPETLPSICANVLKVE